MSTKPEPIPVVMQPVTESVETIKARSQFLRGTLRDSLADLTTGAISEDDNKLLKFHGSYQQDDRDLREQRRQQKLEPAYQFMIRARIAGGVVSPAQWLALDAISQRWAQHGLRITSRQTFQLHGILKRHLKSSIAAINAALISTIAACGDVNRNVVCSALPAASDADQAVLQWAERLSEHLLPKTRAYHEIWLDGVCISDSEPEHEPLYGATYLPRKFKIGLAIPPRNDVDVFAQDLGLIAIIEQGQLQGFNISVGGGMGASHGDPSTYPRLGSVIGFVPPEQLLRLAEAVIEVQRDHGNRQVRKHARLKYTIDQHGLDWFIETLQARLEHPMHAPRPWQFEQTGDRYGWQPGANHDWHLTLRTESGRIEDRGAARWLSGMRAIAAIHRGDFRLTCNQNVIIANVSPSQRAAIAALLEEYGLQAYAAPTGLRAHSLACVALPTCSLAMAESERYLPHLLPRLEALLARYDLTDAPIIFRLSGCPNGCSRPYLGEIALVGRGPGRYDLRLGADFKGQRLNRLYRENRNETEILSELEPLLARYASERQPAEHFGDFLLRQDLLPPAAYASEVISQS